MLFGKIEYLNLLPFHVFMKRYAKTTRHHMTLDYKKGVPSKINRDFKARRIHAAFISSIEGRGKRHINLGIIARKDVRSVLVIPGEAAISDSASATSNVLAHILGLKGEVIIGDNALRHYLRGEGPMIDLARRWVDSRGLPFVFGLLCHHGHTVTLRRMSRSFLRAPQHIPQYLLKEASERTGIAPRDILEYLEHISYEIDSKAARGLRQFWRLAPRSRRR